MVTAGLTPEAAVSSACRLALLLAGAVMVAAAHEAPLAAQARIEGIVSDSATGEPVLGATVRVLAPDGKTAAGTRTDAHGRFVLRPPGPGRWGVSIARVGYAPAALVGVAVGDSGAAVVDIRLAPRPVPAGDIVVTASRQPQVSLQAAASTSSIPAETVQDQITATPIDLLTGVTGMDVASKGLGQRTYTARGSRSASSGSLLTLTDGRDVTLPSIGFNLPYLMPPGSADVDHLEVVRGPAGAAYGPNTERGVAQIFTKSPFDAPGTTVSLGAGGRDLFQGELRQAGVVGTQFGYKLTGEYLSGTDWVYPDTTAQIERDKALQDSTVNPDSLVINVRNPNFERWSAGGMAAWRPEGGGEVQAGVAYANAVSAVDLEPTLGSIQLLDWGFGNAYAEYTGKSWLGRLSYSWNSAGDSYSLWHGNRLVDNSTMTVAQLKSGLGLAHGGTLQYGADFRYTNPRTEGTITGRYENDDQVTEAGAYALGEFPLSTQVRVTAALRGDYHDRIGTVAISPRLGVVYQPTPTQALRLTYGRGYSTPSPTDFFADLQVADDLDGLPFQIQISGIPPGGYQFRRDCGGLCMRTPFSPDPAAFVPIDAAAYWDYAVGILYDGSGGTIDLSGIPAPTSAEVGSVLHRLDLDSAAFDPRPVDPASIQDYPTEGRETTDAIELGYKAVFGGRWTVEADVAWSHTRDFFSASYVGTPNVFLDEAQLAAYLTPYLGGDADQAAAVAAAMGGIPLGVVTPANAQDPNALLSLRRQGGSFSRVGVDVTVSYDLTSGLSVSGNYSWVNRDSIGSAGGSDEAVLSAPTNKGAIAVSYHVPDRRWSAWIQGLGVNTYPVKSGAYKGVIPGYSLVNLGGTYQLPTRQRVALALAVTNLLDKVHQEYVGAPAIGRLIVLRVQTEL